MAFDMAPEMARMEVAPMAMDKAVPVANNRARVAPMMKGPVPMPAAAVPAPPPNRMKPDDDAIVADGEPVEDDFQHVKPGSRQYSHILRKGYSKFSPRIDFT
jgi:hypothetical protein